MLNTLQKRNKYTSISNESKPNGRKRVFKNQLAMRDCLLQTTYWEMTTSIARFNTGLLIAQLSIYALWSVNYIEIKGLQYGYNEVCLDKFAEATRKAKFK